MEVITIDMITSAIYSLAGLSALIVVLTQVFKNWWNKAGKRWLNHLLSFVTSILCNGAVLAIGLIWGVGIYAGFDVNSWMSWLMWAGTTVLLTGVANGLYSYDFMKTFLEWLKLMPIIKK
jgi:hypothetical protein